MLVKLEAKTARAKSLAFHPKRPWILVALHSGAVQLWDYRMGTMLDEYCEHEGPVRGCAFHPTQPLFASCGDDYSVRVYNYRTKKCLFGLEGHMDYVRTVTFHPEAPWLMSASDDQTVRIWNWQNRQCISVLTGHSHYVMCAQFHPKEDLVVSGSLDQTIRVWDISGLRRKGSSYPGSPLDSYPASLSPRSSGQLDLFAPPDGAVKYIMEGHDRGVNWVAFHPTRPLIVSGSDDRTIKVWRYNEIRAWELETLRGHQNNVSCVVFHPKLDLVLSDSEDKTMKVWDISSIVSASNSPAAQKKCQTIRKDERFWSLAVHPDSHLLAYGYDSGFTVFKLEQERPAFVVSEENVFYFHEKVLKAFPLSGTSGKSQSLMSAEHRISCASTLVHNPAEEIVLLSMNKEAKYEMYCLRSGEVKKGDGAFGVFTAKNRFAVLDVASNTINLMSLDNSVYRSFSPDFKVVKMLPAISGSLLLVSDDSVHWWDLAQSRAVFKVNIAGAKYVTWNHDNSEFAILTKNAIHIINRNDPDAHLVIDEPNQVKSAVWKDQLLFYTNAHHLKYVLPNGDVGVVCTLDRPFYLLKVEEDSVFVIDRSGSLQVLTIDPSEFIFKLSLIKRDFSTVMQIIQSSPLVGQAIISYLRKNGYSEVALEFVKDAGSRFELAIEAGRLDMALAEAETLASAECWLRLGDEAMAIGDIEVAEAAFKNGGHEDKLSFLLLVTGQLDKLRRAEVGKGQLVHNSLLLGDWSSLCEALKDDAPCLAYVCAKHAGLSDEASRISKLHGNRIVSCDKLASTEPPAVTPLTTRWPLIDEPVTANPSEWKSTTVHAASEPKPLICSPDMVDGAGWGVEEDITFEDVEEEYTEFEIVEAPMELEQTLPGPGKPLFNIQSNTVFTCLLNGDFELCKDMLSDVGITEFETLLPTIEKLIMSSRVYHENSDYPFVSVDGHYSLSQEGLVNTFEKGLQLTTSGNFKDALAVFKDVYYMSFFSESCSEIKHEAIEYVRGLAIELVRRELPAEDISKSLQLACYFTQYRLREDHLILAIRSAMNAAYKAQCIRLAGSLARRLLDCPVSEQVASQARKILSLADKTKVDDPIVVDYDPLQQPFRICHARLEQIKEAVECKVCFSHFERGGSICSVCGLAKVQVQL